jgi:O-antigen/teichoic acid export membrane protein
MLVAPARTVLLSSFRGREQHRSYAWLNAACLVTVTLSGFFVLLWGGSLFLATVACGVAVIATTLLGWKASGIRPVFPALDRAALAEFGEFIRAGLPFVSWQLTQLAYSQIDRLLMGALVTVSEVGWYASANRIIAIPIFIPTLIITPLFPALSRSAHEPIALRRSFAETIRLVLLLTVPLSAGIIAIASVIPALLGWPADFENTVVPMRILSLQLPIVSVGMVLGTLLMAIGREKRFVVVAVTATGFNIATNLIAIPIFENLTGNGGIGAAVITVASEVVMLLGALMLVPKHLLDAHTLWAAFRIGVAGLATAIVGVALLPVALAASIAGGAVTYVAATFCLRVLSFSDLRDLRSRLAHRH